MLQTSSLNFFTGILFLLFSSYSFAADPDIFSTKKGAIRGVDPVAYFSLKPGDKPVKGSDEFTHKWKGATWKFSSAENRDKFSANPEKYSPQYGGYCAFAVSHNFTKPVNPKYWKIVDGKLYLNVNGVAYKKWVKDEAAAIKRGDNNWPTVLKECEKKNNCRKQL